MDFGFVTHCRDVACFDTLHSNTAIPGITIQQQQLLNCVAAPEYQMLAAAVITFESANMLGRKIRVVWQLLDFIV